MELMRNLYPGFETFPPQSEFIEPGLELLIGSVGMPEPLAGQGDDSQVIRQSTHGQNTVSRRRRPNLGCEVGANGLEIVQPSGGS
jgi:hypothetical protein